MKVEPDSAHRESAANLLGDVASGFGRLIRGELALARAEAKRSLSDATSAVGKLVVAAILGGVALNVLAGAAVVGLVAAGLTPVWASVAVGVGILLVAFVLVQLALSQLKPANLAPNRSMANLRQDAETFKSMVIPDATARQHP